MENKTFDQMNLLDSFLFRTTLGYEEYGKEVSGIILKTILRREVKIKKVVSEMVMFPTKPGLHGVRLDAFIEEEGTEVATGGIYDLEPDKKESEKYHLPKRVRYYHSKIDMHYLEASENIRSYLRYGSSSSLHLTRSTKTGWSIQSGTTVQRFPTWITMTVLRPCFFMSMEILRGIRKS